MIPREPTKEMLDAVEGWDSNTIIHRETARDLWMAMWDQSRAKTADAPSHEDFKEAFIGDMAGAFFTVAHDILEGTGDERKELNSLAIAETFWNISHTRKLVEGGRDG